MSNTVTKQVKKAHCNECGRKVDIKTADEKQPKCVWCAEKYADKRRKYS